MPVKVYLSSRDQTPEDKLIRRAIWDQLRTFGFEPVGFESLTPRALPPGSSLDDTYLPLVKSSDFVVAVVRDEVTRPMEKEIEAARASVGDSNIAYIFDTRSSRDTRAEGIFQHASKCYIHRSFGSIPELNSSLLQIVGGLAEGGLARLAARHYRGFSGPILLRPGEVWRGLIDVPRDGAVAVRVQSSGFFRVRLLDETESRLDVGEGATRQPWSLQQPTRDFSRLVKTTEEGTWTLVILRDNLPFPPAWVDVDLHATFSPLLGQPERSAASMPLAAADGGLPMMVGGQPLMLMRYPRDWKRLDEEVKAYFAKSIVVYLRARNQNRQPVDFASHDEVMQVIRFYDLVASGAYDGREGYSRDAESQLLGLARSQGFLPGVELDAFDTRRWLQIGRGWPRFVDSRGRPASFRRGKVDGARKESTP